MDIPLLRLEGIHKHYSLGENNVAALDGVDLDLFAGDFLSVMGPSGSGKSTLMHIVGCLDRPDRGRYRIDGKDVTAMDDNGLAAIRNRTMGFVFQSFNLLPRTSALENVETPLLYRGVPLRERRRRAAALLEKLGMQDRLTHYPAQLSGGQQQRVAIARALVGRPTVLLADEPTGNLDSDTAREILDLITGLNKDEHLTVLLITHDPLVAERGDRTLIMRDGRIVSR